MRSKTLGIYGLVCGSLGVIACVYGVRSQRWESSVPSEGSSALLPALAFGALSLTMIAFGIRELTRRDR